MLTKLSRVVPVGIAAGLLLAAGAAPAGAAWPGANGSIAFSSSRDGQRNIYVTTGPSAADVRLTTAPADDSNPSFSPDGSLIVFVSRRTNTSVGGVPQIWAMNAADGSGQLDRSNDTISSTEPSWSPDGSRILYSRPEGTSPVRSQIWVMNADGSAKHALFATPTTSNENQAVWSPTGNKVAFVSDRDGLPQVYVVAVDPFTATALGTATRLSDGSAADTKPDWSPAPVGGNYFLAFASGTTDAHQVWKMKDDGTARLQLTNTTADNFDPAWSPDGTSIAFTSHPAATTVVLTASVNSTGGPVTDVTDASGTEGANDEPTWAAAQPSADVPEAPWAVLLPMSGLLVLGVKVRRPGKAGRAAPAAV